MEEADASEDRLETSGEESTSVSWSSEECSCIVQGNNARLGVGKAGVLSIWKF